MDASHTATPRLGSVKGSTTQSLTVNFIMLLNLSASVLYTVLRAWLTRR
jgi:hypothetical protein